MKLVLKARDIVHETEHDVRLMLSPALKRKLFSYLKEKPGSEEVSKGVIKTCWRGKWFTVRDEGVIVVEGEDKEGIEKFQHWLRLKVFEAALEELVPDFDCFLVKKKEAVFEIKPVQEVSHEPHGVY